jgi:two-component system sensor histidine kinase/response regulator
LEIMHQSNPSFKIIKKGQANCAIFGDEMRIEQVIVNFLTNAMKYSPGTEEIFMTVDVKDDQLYVAVKDTGIGMLPEQLAYVFDKFYRVEETSQRFQGLGIGLYISSEIIKRHGGEIGVHSTYGKGSEFYFTIPVNSTTKAPTH